MFFHWSLSDSKSPHFSRTLLSILADLSNTVVWMVSTRPLISKSSTPFNNPFVIVPSASFTIGITVTFMFHSFFNSLSRSRLLLLFYCSRFFPLALTGVFLMESVWQQSPKVSRTFLSILAELSFLFSKRVRTPVALLRSLSGWKSYEPPLSPPPC